MFVEAHKNVEWFHAFINEKLDEIVLLIFHRSVTFLESTQTIPPNSPAKRV
jgi:hypothetical protein